MKEVVVHLIKKPRCYAPTFIRSKPCDCDLYCEWLKTYIRILKQYGNDNPNHLDRRQDVRPNTQSIIHSKQPT